MDPNIVIHKEEKRLIFEKAAEFLIKWLKLYHNITQKTLVLLSGGSVVNLYGKIADFIRISDLDFSFLAFAQVDERFQPGKEFSQRHTGSIPSGLSRCGGNNLNAFQIEKTGLWDTCKEKKIPYYLVSQEGRLEEAARKYNITIKKLFKDYVYKVAVLGIGEDGHTAGLLPGYKKLWDKNAYIVGYDDKGQFKRITLTPKVLRQLDQAVVVVVGEKKKEALENIFHAQNKDDWDRYPGAVIHSIPKIDLFTDIIDISLPGLSS